MEIVNRLFNKVFDMIFLPFSRLDPWWGLAFISLLTALLMLGVFRLASNPASIRRTKDRIKAHLLEFRLYKDSLGITAQAFGGILLRNMRYLSLTLKPLLVMIVPLMLILAQLNSRFGHRPLEPGEPALLKVRTAEGINPLDVAITLEPSSRFAVETPALRIEEENEVDWRLRAESPGRHEVTLRVDDAILSKSLDVGPPGLRAVSPRRPGRNFFDIYFNPAEKPLDRGSKLASVEIAYPPKRLSLFGLPVHWLLAFFVLSLAFGLAFKSLFKVEF